MRDLEWSYSQTESRVGGTRDWEEGEEGVVFTSTQFQLGKMNISRDGWWRWIHNSGNARTAIERHTLKWLKPYKKVIHIKRLYKRLCSFYSNKILAMFSVLCNIFL